MRVHDGVYFGHIAVYLRVHAPFGGRRMHTFQNVAVQIDHHDIFCGHDLIGIGTGRDVHPSIFAIVYGQISAGGGEQLIGVGFFGGLNYGFTNIHICIPLCIPRFK